MKTITSSFEGMSNQGAPRWVEPKLPKWLEYFFAYCGVLALQCGEANNVGDLEKQSFYRFLRSTYLAHPFALGALLYAAGGFPFLVWGMGSGSLNELIGVKRFLVALDELGLS
ncbi:hypothetical protein JHK86_027757 [Glycine max]|nr:hypothetical protein JHK86_027757 [Glycine max]